MPFVVAAAVACAGVFLLFYSFRQNKRTIKYILPASVLLLVSLLICVGVFFFPEAEGGATPVSVLTSSAPETPTPTPTASPETPTPTPTASSETPAPTPTASPETATPSPSPDPAIVAADACISEAIAIIEASRRDDLSAVTYEHEAKLLYDTLSSGEKAFYDNMLKSLRAFEPIVYALAEDGSEAMDQAMYFNYLINMDHPDIENYAAMEDIIDENGVTTAIQALYFMPDDPDMKPAHIPSLRETIELFNAVCERIVTCMPEDYSAYDKYRYLALVVSFATTYDYTYMSGRQMGTAYGSILGGQSICQGYSRGYLYLCRLAGLWCATVDGIASDNYGHMWNMVKLESGTYYVDITWCDELGYPGSQEWESYFMLTQDDILKDHIITDGAVATGTGEALRREPLGN